VLDAIVSHWPEYLIEGALLGIFMIAACIAVVILQHPRSPASRILGGPHQRRAAIGILMGLTAIALIYSPWGQRSGAHMNPGVTLAFLVLGKIKLWDALFYIIAQFIGGYLGVRVAALLLGQLVAHETVNYAATTPGSRGPIAAWSAEFAIAFVLMSMVLASTNYARTAAYTGLFAGALVALYIAIEAPISGMSMNPARTLASAIPARAFRGLWIYFTAPPLAMLVAAGVYVAYSGAEHVFCAKLNHRGDARCIFNCRIDEMSGRVAAPTHAASIQVREPANR